MARCLLIVRTICLNVNNDEAVWETRELNIEQQQSGFFIVLSNENNLTH